MGSSPLESLGTLQKVNGVWPGGLEKVYEDLKGGKQITEHLKRVGKALGGPGKAGLNLC